MQNNESKFSEVDFLVRRFIRNPDSIDNPHTRRQYGTLSSITGIFCNILLFSIKLLTGLFSNSVAVLSDAFNNLSDCASCIVTLLGCKMASKPADKSHPFGHGRMEYLTSLVIVALIFVMGLELLKDSFIKILHPENIRMNAIVIAILILSVAIKLWMCRFNTKLGKRINSTVLLATAKDSRNDAAATSVALISLILSQIISLPVDGIAGVLVSLFILKSGCDIIRDTADELLGKPADPETICKIKEIVTSDKKIIGVHDLIIHSYGPSKTIGSCHAELSSDEIFAEAHDHVDKIERLIREQLNIDMSIHMDPVVVNDKEVNRCRSLLDSILKDIDERLDFHDFRAVICNTQIDLVFDLSVPYEFNHTDDKLKEMIDSRLSAEKDNFRTTITIDKR